jgi:hypothetical protein
MPANINVLADIRYLLAVDFAIPSILTTDKSWFVGMLIVYHHTVDDRLYQMSHSAKIVSASFYEHALAAILAVSAIHAMKREQSHILAVSAMLAVSVAHVIWRDSLAKIADTKIIGIDTQSDIWYNLSSVLSLCKLHNSPQKLLPKQMIKPPTLPRQK